MGIRPALCLRVISRQTDRFWQHPRREHAIPAPVFELAVASRGFQRGESESANGGSSSTDPVMASAPGEPTTAIKFAIGEKATRMPCAIGNSASVTFEVLKPLTAAINDNRGETEHPRKSQCSAQGPCVAVSRLIVAVHHL